MIVRWLFCFFQVCMFLRADVLQVCVSFSMPYKDIVRCARYARCQGADLCVAGLWCEGVYDILRLLLDIQKETNTRVSVDPALFAKHGVDRVPTIISTQGVYRGEKAYAFMVDVPCTYC